MDTSAIRQTLLSFGETNPPSDLTPTLSAEASALIADDAFAFLLACSLDRGSKAEIVWTIPYLLWQELGHLDPQKLAVMPIADLSDAISRLPKRPRYTRDAPRTIKEVASLVARDLDGRAENLWLNRSARQVNRDFANVHGVGPGIASMTLFLLAQCRDVDFPDKSEMDVKLDVHVQRVMRRLGLIDSLSETKAIRAAAQLNPDYPAALDSPLWTIGRTWCRESYPICAECVMKEVCPKIDEV